MTKFTNICRIYNTYIEVEIQDRFGLRCCSFIRQRGSIEWSINTHGLTPLYEILSILETYTPETLDCITSKNEEKVPT